MTSNGTLQDGCDERHDVRFRKRWRCLLRVKRYRSGPSRHVRFAPSNDRTADIRDWQLRATALILLPLQGVYPPRFLAPANIGTRPY